MPGTLLKRETPFDIVFEFSPKFTQTVGGSARRFCNSQRNWRCKNRRTHPFGGMAADQESLFSNILKDPVVTISLKEFEKPKFIANGMVTRPGKYPLRTDTTLMEAMRFPAK